MSDALTDRVHEKRAVECGCDHPRVHIPSYGRSAWAWEFLRRHPDYTAMAERSGRSVMPVLTNPGLEVLCTPLTDGENAARWGLHFP